MVQGVTVLLLLCLALLDNVQANEPPAAKPASGAHNEAAGHGGPTSTLKPGAITMVVKPNTTSLNCSDYFWQTFIHTLPTTGANTSSIGAVKSDTSISHSESIVQHGNGETEVVIKDTKWTAPIYNFTQSNCTVSTDKWTIDAKLLESATAQYNLTAANLRSYLTESLVSFGKGFTMAYNVSSKGLVDANNVTMQWFNKVSNMSKSGGGEKIATKTSSAVEQAKNLAFGEVHGAAKTASDGGTTADKTKTICDLPDPAAAEHGSEHEAAPKEGPGAVTTTKRAGEVRGATTPGSAGAATTMKKAGEEHGAATTKKAEH